MPDRVFSSARLRGYRVLEAAGFGPAADLLIHHTVIAARLWLPISIIEVAFRNVADSVISDVHPAGTAWLFDPAPQGGSFKAAETRGNPVLCSGGVDPDDPVASAAVMASTQLARAVVTRDDVVAHLMLGFWVVRVPDALGADESKTDVFELVSQRLGGPLGDATRLRKLMRDEILLVRNRVAHHEPVVFRAKHVFAKRDAAPKTGNDLVSSLVAAVEKFERQSETLITTASAMAPMAAGALADVAAQLRLDLQPMKERLAERATQLAAARDARRAALRGDGIAVEAPADR